MGTGTLKGPQKADGGSRVENSGKESRRENAGSDLPGQVLDSACYSRVIVNSATFTVHSVLPFFFIF